MSDIAFAGPACRTEPVEPAPIRWMLVGGLSVPGALAGVISCSGDFAKGSPDCPRAAEERGEVGGVDEQDVTGSAFGGGQSRRS